MNAEPLSPEVMSAVRWNMAMGRITVCRKCSSMRNSAVKSCVLCDEAQNMEEYRYRHPRT